jgi:hypothetical protein
MPVSGFGQLVSGSWYGRADVEMAGMHNNYLTELVLKQKGDQVDGVFGYYFRDKYTSCFVHGRYNAKTREVTILNIPVIYYKSNSTVNSIDCITNFRAVIIKSKVGSTLKGYFYHDERYKYMCPDLKVSYELDRNDQQADSVFKVASTSRMWKPQEDDYVVNVAAAAPPVRMADTVAATAKMVIPDSPQTAMIQRGKTDSVKDSVKTIVDSPKAAVAAMSVGEPAKVEPAKPPVVPAKQDAEKITESFVKRKAVLNRDLSVESDSIRLSFYDNGEIDGDSISVFVNNQPVLTHHELAAKAFNVYLHLDSTREVNEISMFAENLGRLPPNTALMVVTDGKNRYEVFMSSNLKENATIRLVRKR